MQLLLWVALGGVLGGAARTLVEVWRPQVLAMDQRLASVVVNLLGAGALGAVMHVGLSLQGVPQGLRIGLAAGLLGGFTTAAVFNNDTVRLFRLRAWPNAAAWVLVDTVSCLLAGMAGLRGARWFLGS